MSFEVFILYYDIALHDAPEHQVSTFSEQLLELAWCDMSVSLTVYLKRGTVMSAVPLGAGGDLPVVNLPLMYPSETILLDSLDKLLKPSSSFLYYLFYSPSEMEGIKISRLKKNTQALFSCAHLQTKAFMFSVVCSCRLTMSYI